MLVTTRKKSWRLDGHKLDRQRDWLGVSVRESTSIARWLAPAQFAASETTAVFSSEMLRALACLTTAAAMTGLGATSGTSAAQRCKPTANDVAGPFQRLDAPRRARIGTGHVLLGRVVRAGDCKPVAGAVVFLWQAGPNGYVYRPRGRASVITTRTGTFRFEGPVPASSGLRPPHIHIVVSHAAYEELLTRYVVRRGTNVGRMTFVLTPLL